jgi:hypothetical protein
MIAFLKTADRLGAKLAAVYALNVTDILLTLALKSTGAFFEGNPLMALFMGSPVWALLVKLLLPAALAVFLHLRLRGATAAQRRQSNRLICVLIAFYALVNAMHLAFGAAYLAFKPFA